MTSTNQTDDQLVTGLATLQIYLRRNMYAIHLVRSTATGTPGDALCGLERFGPDAPGWSVGGGVSGPVVTQWPCPLCAAMAVVCFPGLMPTSNCTGGPEMRMSIHALRAPL